MCRMSQQLLCKNIHKLSHGSCFPSLSFLAKTFTSKSSHFLPNVLTCTTSQQLHALQKCSQSKIYCSHFSSVSFLANTFTNKASCFQPEPVDLFHRSYTKVLWMEEYLALHKTQPRACHKQCRQQVSNYFVNGCGWSGDQMCNFPLLHQCTMIFCPV